MEKKWANKSYIINHKSKWEESETTIRSTSATLPTDGIDEFYAEMTGDMARDAQPYDATLIHKMQGYIKQRSFTDKNGQTRFENQIIITRMS